MLMNEKIKPTIHFFSGKKSNNQIKNILFGISKSVAFSPSSWYANFKLSGKKNEISKLF